MDLDEVYRSIQAALRQVNEREGRADRELARLGATLAHLLEVLAARGDLTDGERRLIERAGRAAERETPSRVRLRQYVDKYTVASADIDCAARLPLCRARCCSLSFELSAQDVEEGVVRWELDEPYVIRHETDGACTHLGRESGRCGVYDHRPAACRTFDCREDPRIWTDFEKRIPAA